MNPPHTLLETAHPVPHSPLLPPLRALIEAMDEVVFSGELDALAGGSTSCDEPFHARELSTALHRMLHVASSGRPGPRDTSTLELAVCLDLRNLLCPLLVFWPWVGHPAAPLGTDRSCGELFRDLLSGARQDARRYAAVLETGRWDAGSVSPPF